MARIYIGRTTGIGAFERHVVLKLILPERADDHVAISMFLDEARLAAMLNHQNVAQVFEVGQDAGIHYLAMEYVHGQDLRALLAKAGASGTRVPIELGLTIAAGAASGLHHAHERRAPDGSPLGIVHRDVSPSNIMVGYDGAVKMLDFGIAKAAQRSVETVSGIIKGKFAYMSPEQCRGREVDRRSDVFSLGIILYEVTTQHRCFRADSDFDTMHRIVTGDVVRPSRLVPGYPAALEAIVMKALAVDPTQRYQSAGYLLEAIEHHSLQHRAPLSTMALGRFMRDMFGDVAEPWLVTGPAAGAAHPAEGTISNTQDREAAARAGGPDQESRYPAAPAPVAPAPAPAPVAYAIYPQALHATPPHGTLSNPTLIDPPRDEDLEWERARAYPVGSMPAVASAHTLPPGALTQIAPHTHREPHAPVPPSPPTIQGLPPMTAANTSSPGIPLPVGSSPGLAPPGSGPLGAPFPMGTRPGGPGQQPSGAFPSGSASGGQPHIPVVPPQAAFGGMSTGSGASVSHVTPYPELDGMSLKPGRRGLYIGIGLAAAGILVAIAIGRSGDGPRSAPPPAPPVEDPTVAASLPSVGSAVGSGSAAAADVTPPAPAPTPTPAPPPPPTPARPPDPPVAASIKVVIDSDPSDAAVMRDGKLLGRTPYETTFTVDDTTTAFTLRRDGYADETVVVKHDRDTSTVTKLTKKKPAEPPPSQQTKSTSPTRPKGKPKAPASSDSSSTTSDTSKPDKADKPDKCQKRGGPIQPFGPKLPLCPE